MWLDPTIVGAEVMGLRGERWLRVWSAPSTALAAAVAKPPEKLTRDDVMLAACGALTFAVTRAKGMTEAATRASMDEMEMFVLWMQNDIHGLAKSSDEASHDCANVIASNAVEGAVRLSGGAQPPRGGGGAAADAATPAPAAAGGRESAGIGRPRRPKCRILGFCTQNAFIVDGIIGATFSMPNSLCRNPFSPPIANRPPNAFSAAQ